MAHPAPSQTGLTRRRTIRQVAPPLYNSKLLAQNYYSYYSYFTKIYPTIRGLRSKIDILHKKKSQNDYLERSEYVSKILITVKIKPHKLNPLVLCFLMPCQISEKHPSPAQPNGGIRVIVLLSSLLSSPRPHPVPSTSTPHRLASSSSLQPRPRASS